MSRSPRHRTKSVSSQLLYYNQFGSNYTNQTIDGFSEVFDDFLNDDFSDFNPCFHVKITDPISGTFSREIGFNTVEIRSPALYDMSSHEQIFSIVTARALNEINYELDFQKNNNFELLNLIGELDDLIATFTIKFWKSLSYGAFNWGILPLISDIKSLASSFDDIFGGRFLNDIEDLNSRQSMTFNCDFEGEHATSLLKTSYQFKGKLRLRGSFSTSLPNSTYAPLLVFLDELGVHPDLKTIWDLIPLSFVFDYFLPIGDLLEDLHPRGWFDIRPLFSGEYSITGKLILKSIGGESNDPFLLPKPHRSTCYKRGVVSALSLANELPAFADYKFGLSLRQLFNLGYLAKEVL